MPERKEIDVFGLLLAVMVLAGIAVVVGSFVVMVVLWAVGG